MSDIQQVAPLPGATEITTSTGVVLWVFQMTLLDQQLLRDEAKKTLIAPNPQDYAQALDPEESFIPTTSGKNTEAYEMAMSKYEQAINAYVTDSVYSGYVDSPMGREALIDAYKRVIDLKRNVVPMPEDAWAATLKHAILRTTKDFSEVVKAVGALLPLTGGEVADGIRIFRLSDEQKPSRKVPARRIETPLAASPA